MQRLGAGIGNAEDDAGLAPIERGFRAAIDEAVRFVGATAPNPPVGCAILDADGRMLSVAAHQRAGTAHAEALALQHCREAGSLAQARTLVVTLEPCNHTGRTPPCTEAILATPITEIWVGAADPNPRVRGGGEGRLRQAGRAVHRLPPDHPCALDCAALIAPFARSMRDGRPWITVKQALDASGSMIPPAGAKTFTGPDALRLAHLLRRSTDAIITGMGTILADRPHFTVRHVPDHPDRSRILAVPDRDGGLPDAYRREAAGRGLRLVSGADFASLLPELSRQGVLWAMVEAGPRLLAAIERDELWDDWLTIRRDAQGRDRVATRSRRPVSPLRLIREIAAPSTKGAECSPES